MYLQNTVTVYTTDKAVNVYRAGQTISKGAKGDCGKYLYNTDTINKTRQAVTVFRVEQAKRH